MKFLRVAICYHYYIPEIELDHGFDTTRALNPMTAPFKIAFDKAFSEVRVRETHAREITISSVRGTVDRIFIFSSDKERLNGTERDDFIVYYRVFIEDEMDANTVESLTTNNADSLKARESVLDQTSADLRSLRLAVYTGYTGHRAWISKKISDSYAESVACISAFYFYAWILALRIERNQLMQDITPQIRAGDKTVRQIIEQRMRLLNLERYFLLGDRSNDPSLKEISVELRQLYRLDERYLKASARHEAFENHINNASKALQSQRAASLTKMVFLLTVLSVPLATMQVLFGINMDSAIYQKTKEMFLEKTTWAVVVVAVSIVAVPILAARLFDFIRVKKREFL